MSLVALDSGSPRTAAGGTLFLASDALLALEKLGGLHLPAHEGLVMATYTSAQALLAANCLRRLAPAPPGPGQDLRSVTQAAKINALPYCGRSFDRDHNRDRLVRTTRCALRRYSLSAGKHASSLPTRCAFVAVGSCCKPGADLPVRRPVACIFR